MNVLINAIHFLKVVSTRSSSHSRVLPKSLHEVGKALLNHKDLVSAVLNSKDLYSDAVNRIMVDLTKECVHLCEKKRFSSTKKLKESTGFSVE